jgi:hypothetical protein
MASVAEPSPQRYSDYRERGTKLPANGREKWRRRKLLSLLPKLTETEQDLLWHIACGIIEQ